MSERPPVSRFHDYLAQRQTPPPTLADAAIALGVPVFPCDAHKRPLTAHGFKDATAEPAAIRRMFQNPNAVMIGVPTGAIVGWVVVDVDVKDGAQGAAWLDANSHRMVQTRTIRTGSGGLHLYFRWPGQPIKNSASKIAPGIDVRGDGGYVIVPPSPGYAVADNAPIADAPDWLLPALIPPAAPEPAPAPLLASRAPIQDGASILGREALAQRCDEIRNAPDGAKHSSINEAAYAIGGLVAAGHIEEAAGWSELRAALDTLLPRCKDQRAAEKTLRRAFQEGMGRPQSVAPSEEDRPLAPAVWNITQTMLARRKVTTPTPAPALAVPPGLMDVPGALRLFIDHCERTALSPQPFLALAAGICMVGALAGRRYRTSTDLRTNIYAIGVADSGAGKDHARKQIRTLLYEANLAQYLGGSDLASGAGLRSALQRHPAMLFQIDEFGDWLASVLGEKASAHRKQIASMLKELYSSASGPWQGVEYADQSRDKGKPKLDIHQPNACLYGTTTPGQFWTAVAGGSLHDGLLARMLLFVSPCSYPDERDPDLSPAATDLIAALQAIAAGPGEAAGGAGNLGAIMLAATAPEPYTVPETPAATDARRALRQDQLTQQRKHEGTYVTAIAGRLAENAMKLALIRAISRDPASPIIEAEDVAWGRALAQHCVDTLLREAAQNVADSDYERKVNRALAYIRKHGPISSDAMFRKGWRLPGKEREELLRSMLTSGLVIALEQPVGAGGGRPTTRYVTNDGAIITGSDGGPDEA
jgi:hypothetical protein